MSATNHPQHDRRWHHTFPGTADQVRGVRHLVRMRLPDHPDAALVASELVTNAILHTRTGQPGGSFGVLIERRPNGSARIEIEDEGGPITFGTVDAPTAEFVHQAREGGRGLALINELVTLWGTKGDATGRTVWAELPPPHITRWAEQDHAVSHRESTAAPDPEVSR